MSPGARLARPPLYVQKALLAVQAPLGWALGYRGRYPRYSGSGLAGEEEVP